MFNVGIKFDSKDQLQLSELKQQKLSFGQAPKDDKKQKKKFEIQVVEQVSESLQEDFFAIKNEKRMKGSNTSAASSTTAGGLSVAAVNNKTRQTAKYRK